MEYVVPIKDLAKIHQIKEILRKTSLRDLVLFVLGINTGITLQNLLNLKVEDVWDGTKMREFLFLKDEKTGEEHAFYLNSNVQESIIQYLESVELQPNDFLFKSKKNNLPITRQQAYRIINNAAREAGIEGNIGTHTLRKTFGYHAYRKGVAISIIMSILHHYSRSDTLRYIGIDKQEDRLIKVDVNL